MTDFLKSTAPEFPDTERLVRAVVPLAGLNLPGMDYDANFRPKASPDLKSTGPPVKRHPFEVYIVGYTDGDMDEAIVEVYRGTVRADDGTMNPEVITAIDDQFTMTATNDWLYLDCDFDANGLITGITLTLGTTCPAPNSGGVTKWYHPIAHLRPYKTGKSGDVDNGEWEQVKTGYFISQKTNTHLVVDYFRGNPFSPYYTAEDPDDLAANSYPRLVPAPGAQD